MWLIMCVELHLSGTMLRGPLLGVNTHTCINECIGHSMHIPYKTWA